MLLIYAAFLIDFIIGDPKWFPHPVRGVGWLITFFEEFTVKLFGRNRFSGVVAGILVITITVSVVYGSIWGASFAISDPAWQMKNLSPFISQYLPKDANIISTLLTLFWLWAGLSARSLAKAGMEIYRKLKKGELEQAQKSLSMVVGRETKDLDETGVSRAAIETVAENSVDGILSPLFFAAIGGAPLLWAFKAVSTCDSMIGYKNEKYIRFGTFGAVLDDILNYIPARISKYLYPLAASLMGLNSEKCSEIIERDSGIHPSPNSGIPEAAVAGALQVSLGGPAIYDGVVKEKEFFGKEFPAPERKHIKDSIKLMWLVSMLMLAFIGLIFYLAPLLYQLLIESQPKGGGG